MSSSRTREGAASVTRLRYEGRDFDCRPGETVLEALLRQGQSPPFSCRNGSCLVCLQRSVNGRPTEASQRALRPTLARAGYFLPCKCRPTEDLEILPPRAADLFSRAVVQGKELLSPDVCRIRLESATSLYYHAGQFVNLRRADGLTRSYSLASLPAEDYYLEIHVKRMPLGEMSRWLFDEVDVGEELDLQGPNGHCYYVPGTSDDDLLLVANGTGLAPLVGVLRDALHVGHRGRIFLYHGSRRPDGLYLSKMLESLAAEHPSFTYVRCVSGHDVPQDHVGGRAHDVALARHPDLRGFRLFVAGLPEMVRACTRAAIAAGIAEEAIHADAFEVKQALDAAVRSAPPPPPPSGVAEGSSSAQARLPLGEPDPEMWHALGEGELLRVILTDFYTRVFEDPILAPYFHKVTKERVIGQVFSFMRDVFTGQRLYFGMRPRTGHHWMVISNEIFDHRERLMTEVLRHHDLPEHLVERWRRFEESFRGDIVKASPWKLVVDGVEMPLDGFGEEEIGVGTLCDGCERAIEVGERVRYHRRLGTTYCSDCAFRVASG